MKKYIYISIGIVGSGKTFYFKCLKTALADKNVLYLNADSIREELFGDASIQSGNKEVFELLFKRFENALNDNMTESIFIDNTSLTFEIRKKYYDYIDNAIKDNDYEVQLIYFIPNVERSKRWNKQRDRVVPEHVIDKMFKIIEEPNEDEKEKFLVQEINYD